MLNFLDMFSVGVTFGIRAWFRSRELWVMGPPRFRCATLIPQSKPISGKSLQGCSVQDSSDTTHVIGDHSPALVSRGCYMPTSGCYMPTSLCLVRPRTTPYWERSALIPFVTSQTTLNIADFKHLSSLARLPGNFLVGHPSKDYSKSSTLNCGVLMEWATKKKMHLVDIGSTKQFL
jgi:hypothetical protein